MWFSFTAMLLVAASAIAQDKDQGKKNSKKTDRKSPAPVAGDAQLAPGVIVKAEAIRKDGSSVEKRSSPRRRITVNTAAVWRDWVRDQASEGPPVSIKKAAEKGANSVATKGEPADTDTLVVVDIGPDTRIEARYRASNDETSKGASTPAGAGEGSRDPAEKGGGSRSVSARARRVAPDDLRPGLFVEVDFRLKTALNVASIVSVIRPVGGPDTPADK